MPDPPPTAVPAELIEQLRELLADRLSVDEQVRLDFEHNEFTDAEKARLRAAIPEGSTKFKVHA